MDRWAIYDDRGVVYEGYSEEEIRSIFEILKGGDNQSEWWVTWQGDLKLVHVVEIFR